MKATWSTADMTTITELLSEASNKWPNKVFLDFSGVKMTYAEVDRESTKLAHGLAKLGVSKGDRVCALLDNEVDFVPIWIAVNKLGAIFVPINTDMKGEFLRHQLVDTDGSVLIVEPHYADRIFSIENGIPEIHTLVVRGHLAEMPTRLSVLALDSVRSADETPIECTVQPRDLSLLIYTSGTTGPSKGCMVSHNYLAHFGRTSSWASCYRHEDIVWTPCPLFHVAALAGVVVGALLHGATASIYTRFSPSNFWPEIERSGATSALLLSVMLTIIPDMPETDAEKRCHGQLRAVFGAPLNLALIKKWKERFGIQNVASPSYGMSEACPIVGVPLDTPNLPGGSSGKLIDAFDVRIFDDTGNECPRGVAGEIVLRPRLPDIMFQGYWGRAEATAAITRDFWFHTGDIGKIDEEGFFYFVDRKKDYLRRGGENISSFEVEATFMTHSDIAEVAAHAVKSEMSEDELKVTIVLRPNSTLTEDVLCRWSLDRLPHFAVPRYIEFRTFLPRTPSGRTQKFLLRDEGITSTTWDVKKSDVIIPRRKN